MATDFFIKINGIDGESSDKQHAKWIEVIRFSHGASQNLATGRATDVAGRGQFLPFIFVHAVDKATPKLQHHCMSGQQITSIEFQVCRAIGGAQVPVYEIKLENVKVAKATVTNEVLGDPSASGLDVVYQPIETVELVAAKMTWKVTPIKADNTKDGAIEANFNQMTNS